MDPPAAELWEVFARHDREERTHHVGTVTVGITFTSIACPGTDLLTEDVQARLGRLEGVTGVEVEELFEPWSRQDLTEEGRLALRALGVT